MGGLESENGGFTCNKCNFDRIGDMFWVNRRLAVSPEKNGTLPSKRGVKPLFQGFVKGGFVWFCGIYIYIYIYNIYILCVYIYICTQYIYIYIYTYILCIYIYNCIYTY